MRVIAVINQKGGVAKTTTTVNLGHALALRGQRVTLLDLDPQGHLAAYLGINDRNLSGLDRVLLSDAPVAEVLVKARDNLMLIPAGARLDRVEQLSEGRLDVSKRLKAAIQAQQGTCDYLLLDCPPSSGLLVIFALYSCDEVLIPVNGDFLSLHGLSHFLGTLKNVENALGHTIDFRLALTRFHPRRRLAQGIERKLRDYFPGKLLATQVRESAALAEAPSFGKTIFEYEPNSHGSDDYRALAEDLINGRSV